MLRDEAFNFSGNGESNFQKMIIQGNWDCKIVQKMGRVGKNIGTAHAFKKKKLLNLHPLFTLFVAHCIVTSRVTRYLLQNAFAGFVTRKFADLEDIIKLNWLPVKENVEFNIRKLTHKSLYHKNIFPEYLKLSLHQVTAYNLRSSTAPVFSIPKESTATLFNRLRIVIRNISVLNSHNHYCIF